MYNALNMQAQRATLKYLDGKRKIESSVPNRESGLGKINAMNSKLKTEGSISIMESGPVSFILDCHSLTKLLYENRSQPKPQESHHQSGKRSIPSRCRRQQTQKVRSSRQIEQRLSTPAFTQVDLGR